MRVNLLYLGAAFMVSATQAWAGNPEADFLAARDAHRSGNLTRLEAYVPRLQGHVLEPYANYWQLLGQLEQAEPDAVQQFMQRYADSALADRLRGEWLKVLGRKADWALFLGEYPNLVNEDAVITCYALQARLAQGDQDALQEARPLWFSGTDMPSNCSPLYDAMIAHGKLSAEDVWTRLRLALEAGNITVAKRVAEYLPGHQADALRALDSVAENPQRFLDRHRLNPKSRADRELALFALYRIARGQPEQALAYWEKLQPRFSEAEQKYAWGQLAFQAARKHSPLALGWFRKAGSAGLSDVQLGWWVRAALRAREWPGVLAGIDAMSDGVQREGGWRYWKARALKAQGKIGQANAILAPLSKEPNFYGQLADEELGIAIEAAPAAYKASEAELAAVRSLPAIQRALVLYRLDLRFDATREWAWATRNFDDRHLLAAAELARRNEWYDRAINTADKTVQLHDFDLRYPAPYRDVMQGYTRQLALDEAWVYGLVRQESRFVTQARSAVGAGGLMQVMPATAQWIAKRLGFKDHKNLVITRLDTNIELGTYYLKHVQEGMGGDTVLATAAYNAGPGRARRWRDEQVMEGAIYAESIPFTETRDYVKKVMSNAVYYASRFGQKLVTLKQRLGTIAANSGEADKEAGP
jgi:soluble lytic murein transglycosylase